MIPRISLVLLLFRGSLSLPAKSKFEQDRKVCLTQNIALKVISPKIQFKGFTLGSEKFFSPPCAGFPI